MNLFRMAHKAHKVHMVASQKVHMVILPKDPLVQIVQMNEVFPLVRNMLVVWNVEDALLLMEVQNEYNDVLLILFHYVVGDMEDGKERMMFVPSILDQIYMIP